MSEYPSYRAAARFIDFIRSRQSAQRGYPVTLTPDDIARETGISETDQIRIRQTLMLAGRLRLEVLDGRWAYALRDGHV